MSDSHDELTAKWNEIRGARVGDWCETKDSGFHRFGRDLGESLELADPSSSAGFLLNSDGVVTWSGSLFARPAIPKSSLVGLPERMSGAMRYREPGARKVQHFSTPCRVFKET